MTSELTRRGVLDILAAGASLSIAGAGAASAQGKPFPSRPITLINPNPPSGYNDNLARVLSTPLGAAFGQPVTVTNVPGASELLGTEYYLKQPDEGYFLVVAAVSFIPMNIILQKAPFKASDFSMINVPSRDFSLLATSANNTTLKSVADVVAALKSDPAGLSIGVPRASTDYINLVLFLGSLGVDPKKARLVTFESGGNTRTAVLGGVVDCGIVGGEGFLPFVDQIRPLVSFSTDRVKEFNAPTIKETDFGKAIDPVAGSLRGFLVSTAFKEKHPDRYAIVVKAFETVFKTPSVIAALKKQDLAWEWYGPEDSQSVYLKTVQQIEAHADLLRKS